MRLPFLRSRSAATPPRGERARAAAAADESTLVEAARTHARRRLVGALVLLVAGVIGFPIVFETQPRPLPVDTPIIVSPTASPRLSGPAPTIKPPPLPAPAPARPAAAMPAPDAAVEPAAAPPVVAVEGADSTAAPPAAAASVAAAAASAAGSTAAAGARFVVQVGAYTDAAMLRETRAKVEKLGLKTYTQVVASDNGPRTRVRLGPFATRDEADAAAAKVKRAGLPANILAL